MFKSFELVRMHNNNCEITGIYKIIDDDFECECENNSTWFVAMIIDICLEYSKRKLDAGKNLALAFIWCGNWMEISSLKTVINHYEFAISHHINNWSEIKISMNKHLEKMSIWV